VTLSMFAFGLGAALPLLGLGFLSREILIRWRTRLMLTGQSVRFALGFLLAVTGVLILAGLDKRLEAALVEMSPAWLTALTTRL